MNMLVLHTAFKPMNQLLIFKVWFIKISFCFGVRKCKNQSSFEAYCVTKIKVFLRTLLEEERAKIILASGSHDPEFQLISVYQLHRHPKLSWLTIVNQFVVKFEQKYMYKFQVVATIFYQFTTVCAVMLLTLECSDS